MGTWELEVGLGTGKWVVWSWEWKEGSRECRVGGGEWGVGS